mgnify:CR=1 FL=1
MILKQYINGNTLVTLYDNGTREAFTEDDEFRLEYPLNIDIRLSSYCPYGKNPKTNKAICSFCHESALADPSLKNTDLSLLKQRLSEIPKEIGLELAVGINYLGTENTEFLRWVRERDMVVNVTINSLSLSESSVQLVRELLDTKVIQGLGVSYRPNVELPRAIVEHPNTVVHVIAGIDNIIDVHKLYKQGVKKILILGEKDFGYNKGNVNLMSESHYSWRKLLPKLLNVFEIVSFDNLALEQLDIKNTLDIKNWDTFYQGEYSFYINAVTNSYSPSSRSSDIAPMSSLTIKEYFYETNGKT